MYRESEFLSEADMRPELKLDPEYHRRRSEMEMQRALEARQPDEALLHLELARIHREKRAELATAWRSTDISERPPITRTDKEG
jgi:hypothetical protein